MKKLTLAAVIILACAGSTLLVARNVKATGPSAGASVSSMPLLGYAWSSNTGWISFNPANAGTGGYSWNQPVSLSTTTVNSTLGFLSGYAWSSNIGWISFNASDVNNCPTDPLDLPANGAAAVPTYSGAQSTPVYCTPRVDLTTGKVNGWARVVSMVPQGWIHLSGTNFPTGDTSGYQGTSTKGVTVKTTVTASGTAYKFSGYAYEPQTLGWITFSPSFTTSSSAGTQIYASSSNTVTEQGGGGTTASCTVNGVSQVTYDQTSSNTTVTLSVSSAQGGAGGPYTYVWHDGRGNSTTRGSATSQTYTYDANTVASYSPTVTVYDNTLVASQTPVACGVVKVVNNTNTSLGLYIGSTASVAAQARTTTFVVTKGGKFGMHWNNTLDTGPNGYSCLGQSVGNSNPFLGWYTSGNDSNDIDTAGVQSGVYQFQINCKNHMNATDIRTSNVANLKVQTSSTHEF